jgi:hypothetical protein
LASQLKLDTLNYSLLPHGTTRRDGQYVQLAKAIKEGKGYSKHWKKLFVLHFKSIYKFKPTKRLIGNIFSRNRNVVHVTMCFYIQ